MASNSYGWASPPYRARTADASAGQSPDFSMRQGLQARQQQLDSAQLQNPAFQQNFATMAGGGNDVGGPGNPFGPPTGMPMGPQNFNPFNGGPPPDPFAFQGQGQSASDYLKYLSDPSHGAAGAYGLMSPEAFQKGRSQNEDYMNNFFTPYVNAQNATRTTDFNIANGVNNANMQNWLNQQQIGLANKDNSRQNLALQYGQQNNTRDFGESQRQFNQQQQLDTMYKTGQISAQNYANETQRLTANQNYGLGQGQNQNAANANANNYALGQQQNKNTLTGMNQNYQLGQGQNANTLLNYQNQYKLGQGQNQNQAYDNQTKRTDVGNQFTLGQGQLGYQNRQLDTTNAFNRQKLAQDANLTREGYANDTLNQRYQTFGRAQQPNFRAVGGFK